MNVPLATLRSLPKPSRHDPFYDALGRLECGLLDGGCLVFALAAQAVIGGEVWVVRCRAGRAQHYVLRVGPDWFLDGDGVARGRTVRRRMVELEGVDGPCSMEPAALVDGKGEGEVDAGPDLQPAMRAAVRSWLRLPARSR